jgi:ribosome modulation factor
MFLRKRLALEEARRRGFEDGIAGSATEPLDHGSDAEHVAYDAAKTRGIAARESLGGQAIAEGERRPKPYGRLGRR